MADMSSVIARLRVCLPTYLPGVKAVNCESLCQKKRKQKRKRRTHKYQIREHPQNMRLGNMLNDLAGVHNHFLALENRYYRIYGKYAGRYRLPTALDEVTSTHP